MVLEQIINVRGSIRKFTYFYPFKLADWFQRRRFLNNFPIGSYVKTMSADGGHFEPRSGSLNTILEVDYLRTIDDMFAILAYWFQRRRFENIFFHRVLC